MASTLETLPLDRLGALLHLVDPTLPIGGFNHSYGLETFVQQQKVYDKTSLQEYIQTQLLQNWIYNDGAYLSLAFDATKNEELDALICLDRELGASKIARESREACFKLGIRLLKIFIRYQQSPLLKQFEQAIEQKQCRGFYPIVFAMAAVGMSLSKQESLFAFYYNNIVSAVTNGVKLIPLSQMDGQDILVDLRPLIGQAVVASESPDPAWLGASTIANDIRAMQHEQLYSRLYMS